MKYSACGNRQRVSRIAESLGQNHIPKLKEPEKVFKAVCYQSFKALQRLFTSQSVSDSGDIKRGGEFYKTSVKKKLNSRKES